jgi:hypothetical protein
LRSFLKVPDNVLFIGQDRQMMCRLDAAFLRVGEAKGRRLIKYLGDEETWNSLDEVRSELERYGLEVGRLEEEGHLRFIFEPDPQQGGRAEELRRLLSEQADGGDRSIWVSFNWAEQMNPEAALEQQQTLQEVVEISQLVIKTSVLEKTVDQWLGKMLRRAQVLHLGTIWLSESGLALNRVTQPPLLS